MKVMFTVQGEGRGHMTQAIAMQEMLQRHGHRVAAVLVGSNQNRSLPAFFEEAFAGRVQSIASPGFAVANGRGISLVRTAANAFANAPTFSRSLRTIHETVTAVQPDLIVNFLEPLLGVYNAVRRHHVPVLAVGHQFMLDHQAFVQDRKRSLDRLGMSAYVALTGTRSAKLALSFYKAPDLPRRRLFVCPPILRRQLFEQRADSFEGHLLVYLLNAGYADDIVRWHRDHPEMPVHCFYDKPGAPDEERVDSHLTFHKIHGEKFLRLMASARGVACTAGFESVSEAAYLGKQVLMIPVENHFEQFLNARDAEQTGIGMADTTFRLSRLLEPVRNEVTATFRDWVDQAEAIAMNAVETVAGVRGAAAGVRNGEVFSPVR
jgi:uncharacterized protein (TIGR00661 family)